MSDTDLIRLEKKLDKLLNLNTKIAKALHLIPVTEKEERALQIQQRSNLNTAAKINAELNAIENKEDNSLSSLSLNDIVSPENVYEDIIDTDYLGGK